MSSTFLNGASSLKPKGGTTGDLDLAVVDDMPEYAEYAYHADDDHMTESEATERYKAAKAMYPGAIINLEELPCGHYAVNIYRDDWQKDSFYKRIYSSLLRNALDRILRGFEVR